MGDDDLSMEIIGVIKGSSVTSADFPLDTLTMKIGVTGTRRCTAKKLPHSNISGEIIRYVAVFFYEIQS